MMAAGLPPIASRNTTKRVGVPEVSGTEASLATTSERIASSAKRATASASTVTILSRRGDGIGGHIRHQHRRQTLRYLDKLNGDRRGPTGRLGRWNIFICRVGNKGQNRIRVVTRPERQCHRRRCIKAERERAPLCNNEPRRNRSAKRHEFSKPLPVETFDRQREYRFARLQ